MQVITTNRFRFGFVRWVSLLAVLLLTVLLMTQAASAQIDVGGAHVQNLSGTLGFGYNGQTGVAEPSMHDTGLSGNLSSNGFYYNPGFLSFQANTYYTRADSSSDSNFLSDSEGYNLGVGIFGGSQSPGYVSFGQNLGQNGSYGLPGVTGLNSTNNNRQFAVNWLFKNLPVKNLSVFFADTANDTTIPGIGLDTNASTKGFGVSTGGYNIAGFSLAAGYQGSLSKVTDNITGADGESVTSNGSSNVFHVMTSRALPRDGSMNVSAYRIMTNSSGEGEAANSAANEVDASITEHVWRLPLSGTISYNDNVYGTALQQLNASGQLVNVDFNGPKIGELNTTVSSSYTLPHRIFVTGYVNHQEEFVGGQSVGATSFGGNFSYGFGKFMKGLTLTVGMHDAASQVGNTGAGLVASGSYTRNVEGWHVNAFGSYNQGIQTLLATTTESSASASVSIRRNFLDRFTVGANAGMGRSLFSSVSGEANETKTAGVNFGWMKQTLSASYADSSGTAIITSAGLVGVPVPGLESSSVTTFSGKNYSAGYSSALIKHMNVNFAWGRYISTGTGTGLLSDVSGETYSGGMIYTYRKINFIANYARSKQGASQTTALPSDITVFYFGFSRWFNFF